MRPTSFIPLAALLLALAAAPAAAQSTSSTAAPPEGWSRHDRWQIALHDGSYLWELRLVGVRGDTLVARQADTLVAIPLDRVDELRLIQASVRHTGTGEANRATSNALAGADDEVYALVRYAPGERRKVVEQALAAHPPR
jgi:hypothetical protein